MSKKQNKKHAQKKDLADMERKLAKEVWNLEAEVIPMEDLTPEEQDIVQKCIDKVDLPDGEFNQLKKILQRYRPYIHKHNPKEAIEQVEVTKNLIRTEKDLLDIINNRNNTLKVALPLDGETYNMEFEILPINDSTVVESMELQVNMFQDFSNAERTVYQKSQHDERMSKEEEAILASVNRKINEKAGVEANRMCNKLLSAQLRLPDSSADESVRQEFWEKFPFNPKFQIFYRVQQRLGLTEASNEDLFPSSN